MDEDGYDFFSGYGSSSAGDKDPFGVFTYGAAGSYVPADVSMGAPSMQTSQPTANEGSFDWQKALFGGLQTALQYAIVKDQQKFTAVAAPQQQYQAQQYQQQAATANDKRMLMYLAIGVGIFLVVKS